MVARAPRQILSGATFRTGEETLEGEDLLEGLLPCPFRVAVLTDGHEITPFER